MKEKNPDEAPSGFTWRVVIGLIYGMIILLPAAIWLMWSTGVSARELGSAAQYTVLLLFTTLAASAGNPFSKQEAFVLYSNVMSVVTEFMAPIMVFQYYVRQSPIAQAYGLSNLLPDWWAPPPGSINRTMFDPNWFPVMIVWLILNGLLLKLCNLSIGYLTYQLFAVEEKLPFPGTKVWAEACITIAEGMKRPEKFKLLTYTAVISMVFSSLTYGVWLITGSQLIPVFNDMTSLVGVVLPGASFGLTLDLLLMAIGFIIPWHVCVSIFIGGITTFMVVNPILVKMGVFYHYKLAMSSSSILYWSRLDFWISPMIGIIIAAGIIPIIRGRKYFIGAFKRLTVARKTVKGEEKRPTPLWIVLILFLSGTVGSAVLTMLLVPDLPFWIPITLSVGWTFLYSLINTRAVGEAAIALGVPMPGGMAGVPYLREGVFFSAGYTGVGGWVAPLIIGGDGGAWSSVYLACDLTETRFRDYLKAYLIAVPLAVFMSIVYVDAFWSMAPIPSASYPYTSIAWPTDAASTLIWPASRENPQALFKIDLIIGSLIIGSVVSVTCGFFHIPFELIGFALGMGQIIYTTVPIFIGGVIGKIMQRRMGKKWWRDNVAVIAAGLGVGEGVLIAVAASIALISKSMWISPV